MKNDDNDNEKLFRRSMKAMLKHELKREEIKDALVAKGISPEIYLRMADMALMQARAHGVKTDKILKVLEKFNAE